MDRRAAPAVRAAGDGTRPVRHIFRPVHPISSAVQTCLSYLNKFSFFCCFAPAAALRSPVAAGSVRSAYPPAGAGCAGRVAVIVLAHLGEGLPMRPSRRSAFTLIELLVVI